MATALYIGRFQPFHNGHLAYVKKILEESDSLIIIIGSRQEHGTKENPFDSELRETMIYESLEKEKLLHNVKIIAIDDFDDDEAWLNEIKKKAGHFDVVYAGESESLYKIFKEKGYDTRRIKRIGKISGTMIRKLISEKKEFKDLVPRSVYNKLIKNSL